MKTQGARVPRSFMVGLSLLVWVSGALCPVTSYAGITGSVSGTVADDQGVALPDQVVRVLGHDGHVVKETKTSATGEYQVFPLDFGDYAITVQAPGMTAYRSVVHVTSGSNTQADVQLAKASSGGKEIVLEVREKRRLVQNSAAVSSVEVNQEQIRQLPQGDTIRLPQLISSTTPGVVPGPFGQLFIRGNHANIQYQIDGVQLPDSPSNTFGESFSPRNIDHMEVITGGIPAEYGQRLASVVNIITKSGPEKPGGTLELNYGTFNRFAPQITFGGSNADGNVHYFLSGNFYRTDRGLDTPDPVSETDQSHGGKSPVHDFSNGTSEFAKVDWILDNQNKLSFIGFYAANFFQIPNYPAGFLPGDPFFQPGFTDQYGNGDPTGASPAFTYTPSTTNDTQSETNAYLQTVWRHSFSERAFLQLAPYWKYSLINVGNDPANDLFTSATGGGPITGSGATSFAENRHVNNLGLKADYSVRPDDRNLIKAGFQAQASRADGSISVQTDLAAAPAVDASSTQGYYEGIYLQDDFTLTKSLVFNAGLRFDATQFVFSDQNSQDSLLQPRIGVNYLLTDTTKLHLFVGQLFMPSPVENLRNTFQQVGGTASLPPYDVKAEKDNYFEFGVAQQIGDRQTADANVYYKRALNMLDDAQLLNTPIAQPYNFSDGYAYGLELSLKGRLTDDWSDYVNYSYEVAKGRGVSGGIFAFGGNPKGGDDFQFLDHVQLHTLNSGLTYRKNGFWSTAQALFGSGLRTGPNNTASLNAHLTANLTVGYEHTGERWFQNWRPSLDVLNLFDNAYAITVANGFNGSHYAAGREVIFHLAKEI